MLNTEFSPWPSFTQDEADITSQVLLSNKVNYWTGNQGRGFEKEFAEFAGTSHAIALANGTVALDLALHGLRIGSVNGGTPQDEVIVTSRSFMASVSAIVNAGAVPVFADVGGSSQNIDPITVAPMITPNTQAILCVHLAGWPCDMDGLRDLVGTQKIALIEDCAQAHGALYKGNPVGGLGDVAAWSFCQDKIMTTGGEGGMVTCNDENLWKRMWAFKDHGKSWDAVYEHDHPPGFRWLHKGFGTNWRLTEMQAALGRYQLKEMPKWQAKRQSNANQLTNTLLPFAADGGPIQIPEFYTSSPNGHRHAWYKYYAFVRPEGLKQGWDRDRIVAKISAQGVPCMQGSCSEIYLEKSIQDAGLAPDAPLRAAQRLGQTSLMLLVHPTLTQDNIDKTQTVLEQVLSEAASGSNF